MSLELFLLGQPHAVRDGQPVDTVRGAKAWALLAYLLLSDGKVDRRRLALLLFPDAADPAGSLRWNLSQLRRGLGIAVDGDPLTLTLPRNTWVDVEFLAHGDTVAAAAVALREQLLLDGVVADELEVFSAWLEGERRHVAALCTAALREAAVRCLAEGDAQGAAVLAERVVGLEPFDENAAVMLVRALREAGRPGEAHAVAAATVVRFRSELGVEPSSALSSAAHASTGGAARSGGAAATQAQLEAGEAAIAAGLPDAGIDALREALGGARALNETGLLARSLTALGSALIHAVRGSDQDGLALLHEAIPLAVDRDLPGVAAKATRELDYVDLLRGRYDRAQRWFATASEHATGDDEELAWIATFAGAARTDVSDHHAAVDLLDEAGRPSRPTRPACRLGTLAGSPWHYAVGVSPAPRAAPSTKDSACSRTLHASAAGSRTPTSGSKPMASTPWPTSRASAVSRPLRTRSINSRRSASATACAP